MIMTIVKILINLIFWSIASAFLIRKLAEFIVNRWEKKKRSKVSNVAKRELKARYFEQCQELVLSAGDGTMGNTSVEEMKEISAEMCDAGMGEIVKQEYDNLVELYEDLGFRMGKSDE